MFTIAQIKELHSKVIKITIECLVGRVSKNIIPHRTNIHEIENEAAE